MQVCFIGHRKIDKTEQLKQSLEKTVSILIKRGFTVFLFGSKSEFDDLSWEIVTKLKEQHEKVKRVYVRSAFKDIDDAYERYLLKSYEESYYPNKIENAGKFSYVERNYEMIDKASVCVFYYDENYTIKTKRKSGTKVAYDYALKKKKEIINLYKQ